MRKEVRYTGRVQGVGFRATARACAQRFPVTGWVRNEPDGAVLLQVQGHERDIDEFLVSLSGAMTRFIQGADANLMPDVSDEVSFEIRRF